MANYIGVHCPVCEKRFAEGDDIVVCPICGAPHHRSCYQELGQCKLSDQHMAGHTWEPPQVNRSETAEPQSETVCASCGAYNPKSGLFCQICGARLGRLDSSETYRMPSGTAQEKAASQSQQGFGEAHGTQTKTTKGADQTFGEQPAYMLAFGGLSPDEELDGVSARDLAIYVGSNSHYFLPRFKLLSEHVGFAPNFAALFFNFFYFFYRKIPLFGAVALLIALIGQLPGLFLMPEWAPYLAENFKDLLLGVDIFTSFQPQNMEWVFRLSPFVRALSVVSALGFSLFANRIYYAKAIRAVKKIKIRCEQASGGFSDTHYAESLAKGGRTSVLSIVLVCVVIFLFYTSVSLYFMMPYMDQMTATMESILTAAQI